MDSVVELTVDLLDDDWILAGWEGEEELSAVSVVSFAVWFMEDPDRWDDDTILQSNVCRVWVLLLECLADVVQLGLYLFLAIWDGL